jgi:hypothetical protein
MLRTSVQELNYVAPAAAGTGFRTVPVPCLPAPPTLDSCVVRLSDEKRLTGSSMGIMLVRTDEETVGLLVETAWLPMESGGFLLEEG